MELKNKGEQSPYFSSLKSNYMDLVVIFKETDTLETFISRYSPIMIIHGSCCVQISQIAMASLTWQELFILSEFLQDRNMIIRPSVKSITMDINTHQHSPSHN